VLGEILLLALHVGEVGSFGEAVVEMSQRVLQRRDGVERGVADIRRVGGVALDEDVGANFQFLNRDGKAADGAYGLRGLERFHRELVARRRDARLRILVQVSDLVATDLLCDSFYADLQARHSSARREFVDFHAADPLHHSSRLASEEFSKWRRIRERLAAADLSVKFEIGLLHRHGRDRVSACAAGCRIATFRRLEQ
jgi:hypothetical protein